MRRITPIAFSLLLLASCGSSSSTATTTESTASGDSTPSSELASTGDSATSGSTTPGSADGAVETATTPALVAASIPSDCPPPDTSAATTVPVLPDPGTEPTVSLPKPPPTELKITDLKTGTGPKAAAGDTISVYYLGVLSADGTKFDTNIGSGQPFTVSLGQGQVIPGWDEGLVGAQAGTTRQLDIPAEMAYGAAGSGDKIPPNSPLTFIVDVVAVTPAPPAVDPATEPTYEFKEVLAPAEFKTETLVPGDKCDIAQLNDTVLLNIKMVRGDNLEVLDNSWKNGRSESIPLDGAIIYGLTQGVIGMGKGEQRLIIVPPEYGFGNAFPDQIPPDAVLELIVEFVGRP